MEIEVVKRNMSIRFLISRLKGHDITEKIKAQDDCSD